MVVTEVQLAKNFGRENVFKSIHKFTHVGIQSKTAL